jgi:hypothetical protein
VRSTLQEREIRKAEKLGVRRQNIESRVHGASSKQAM